MRLISLHLRFLFLSACDEKRFNSSRKMRIRPVDLERRTNLRSVHLNTYFIHLFGVNRLLTSGVLLF